MDERYDSQQDQIEADSGPLAKHRFMIMIICSVIIAFLMVMVSLQLYSTSGTAQFDLSRPGYKSVRDQIKRDEAFDGFPATGAIDKAALDQFKELYDKRANDLTAVDAFGSDVLTDQVLGIDAPVEHP